MLERDRIRSGLSVGQLAWQLGVSPRNYRELEAGESYPDSETYDRVCESFGGRRPTLAEPRERASDTKREGEYLVEKSPDQVTSERGRRGLSRRDLAAENQAFPARSFPGWR